MIRLTVKKQIGSQAYHFAFEGNTLFDVIQASQHLAFRDLKGCANCQSEDLELHAYKTEKEKYEYVKVRCRQCRAQLTFGKTKKEGAFFFRRDKNTGGFAWEEPPPKSSLAAVEDEPE